MKKILRASLSAVLVLSLVGCGSTKDEAIYQDSIDAYVNEIDMDYAYDFTKTLSTDTSLHDKCDSSDQNCSDRNSSVYKYNIDVLHKLGFKTCAMALTDDSVSIDDPVLHSEERLAIVLGTEGDGLHEQTIDSCDYTVKIPMSHGVDSLNVAAASAVAFWELAK